MWTRTAVAFWTQTSICVTFFAAGPLACAPTDSEHALDDTFPSSDERDDAYVGKDFNWSFDDVVNVSLISVSRNGSSKSKNINLSAAASQLSWCSNSKLRINQIGGSYAATVALPQGNSPGEKWNLAVSTQRNAAVVVKKRHPATDIVVTCLPEEWFTWDTGISGQSNGSGVLMFSQFCDNPNLIVHEILHQLGMQHNDYGGDVMHCCASTNKYQRLCPAPGVHGWPKGTPYTLFRK